LAVGGERFISSDSARSTSPKRAIGVQRRFAEEASTLDACPASSEALINAGDQTGCVVDASCELKQCRVELARLRRGRPYSLAIPTSALRDDQLACTLRAL